MAAPDPLLRPLAALVLLLATVPAHALEYQVHGFAAQGFLLSAGNDFYGDSTDGGSFSYYEAGANGTVKPLSSLLLSAQVVAREAGATDDGKLRLDYGFLDWAFVSGARGNAGARAGRVKNSFGLYNETRDVVFTRPGVLMPSVYYDTQGARALLFSSDGVQAYGGATWGDHYTTLVGSTGLSSSLSDSQQERLGGGFAGQGEMEFEEFYLARLQDESDGGRWTSALSYLRSTMEFEPYAGVPVDFSFTFDLYLLSARYSGDRFALTAEYGLTDSAGTFTSPLGTSGFHADGDAAYVQLDWFLDSAWTVMTRWDSTFTDRHDRDGDTCAAGDRHACFAHDFMLGASWKSPQHWGAWGEVHVIAGLATASSRDNAAGTLENHWSVFMLMAAYRF